MVATAKQQTAQQLHKTQYTRFLALLAYVDFAAVHCTILLVYIIPPKCPNPFFRLAWDAKKKKELASTSRVPLFFFKS